MSLTDPILLLAMVLAAPMAAAMEPPVVYKGEASRSSPPGVEHFENMTTVCSSGPWLFGGSHYGGGVCCFERDAQGLPVKYVTFLDVAGEAKQPGMHCDCWMATTKDLLFVVANQTHTNAPMGGWCYQFGKTADAPPKLVGHFEGTGQPLLSPDGKTLYVAEPDGSGIAAYRIDATKVTLLGKTSGKGMKGALALWTPADAKAAKASPACLYAMSSDDGIGCAHVAVDGSLTYVGASPLGAAAPTKGPRCSAFAVSPDGRHAYTAFWTYDYDNLSVFSRDAKSGELKFQEQLEPDKNMWAINGLVFTPDGQTALYSSMYESPGNCVGWATRDPATGKLTFGGVIDRSKGRAPMSLFIAPDTHTVYTPTWGGSSALVAYGPR